MAKNLVLGSILAHLVKIPAAKFFFLENPTPSFARYNGQLSSYITSEKTNDWILRKPSDERRDGQRTDRQTDRRREWFHRTLFEQQVLNILLIECSSLEIFIKLYLKTFSNFITCSKIEVRTSLAGNRRSSRQQSCTIFVYVFTVPDK